MFIKKTAYAKAIFASLSLFLALPSSASVTATSTLMTHYFSGKNDCNNDFFQDPGNKSFSACKVAIGDYGVDKVYLADVIAKFDMNGNGSPDYTESKEYANEIDASNWLFNDGTRVGASDKIGDWSYSGSIDAPGIKFWTAKAGNGFSLFWWVEDTENSRQACDPETYTLDCLTLAQTVGSGSWITPKNKGLSHLTFFGNIEVKCTTDCGSDAVVTVSEPQTLVLFSLATIGIFLRNRRQRKTHPFIKQKKE